MHPSRTKSFTSTICRKIATDKRQWSVPACAAQRTTVRQARTSFQSWTVCPAGGSSSPSPGGTAGMALLLDLSERSIPETQRSGRMPCAFPGSENEGSTAKALRHSSRWSGIPPAAEAPAPCRRPPSSCPIRHSQRLRACFSPGPPTASCPSPASCRPPRPNS